MNRIYRSIWNDKTKTFVAVSEIAKSGGRQASAAGTGAVARTGALALTLPAALMLTFGSSAWALPVGGVVSAGSASIVGSAAAVTINQASQTAAINWQSFNIGQAEAVKFVQPNSSAVALNRVLGSDPSSILGSLSANGRVFLMNPNGILFGKGASVNVAGLVASTLNVSDADFMVGKYNFTNAGPGSVVNQAAIHADGGYVALLGAKVSNQGVIAAKLGTVALAAGNAMTLDVAGDGLLNVVVNQAAVNALVENSGLIQADGGLALLTAQAAGSLLSSAVNNTGVIQTQTIENHAGTISLLADMHSGTAQVGGTLDASAPNGGHGGFIETSAAHVKVADGAKVTTLAALGKTGSWLIDPIDYTVAVSGGDETGASVSASLGTTNRTVRTAALVQGQGDIFINDAITWSNGNKLELVASRDININANITNNSVLVTTDMTPLVGSLSLKYGQGDFQEGNGALNTLKAGAVITLPSGPNYSTTLGSDGVEKIFTVITRVGAPTSISALYLQGLSNVVNLAGNYALGADLSDRAGDISAWNGGLGFTPIGTSITPFTGSFNGFGHTISGLAINRSGTVGLFGTTGATAVISNLGLLNVSNTGGADTGGLVGNNAGLLSNVYTTGSVTGAIGTGGLVGTNAPSGKIVNSYSAATVTNIAGSTGGLVGVNDAGAMIKNSYATGIVIGAAASGGLVGTSFGNLDGVHATGSVTGAAGTGGLVGANAPGANISNSYATGNVSNGIAASIGGLVGASTTGNISDSYATGNVTGGAGAGGLLGANTTGNISGSYATGNVTGEAGTGGLLGANTTGNISNSYATGNVSGGAGTGGLAGRNTTGALTNTFTTGKVLSNEAGTGALLGYNTSLLIKNSYYDVGKNPSTAFSKFGTGLTTDQALLAASYVGFSAPTWTLKDGGAPILTALQKAVTVNVTASNASKIYDSLVYSGPLNVTNSDAATFSSLTGTLIFGGAFKTATNAGSYAITPSGLTSANAQFSIVYVNGSLTITPAPLTVTANAFTKTYDGSTAATGATQTTGILFGSDVASAGMFAFTDKNAGVANKTLAVSGVTAGAGGNNSNYTITYVNNTASTITPLVLTGTISTGSSIYGAALVAGAVNLSNVIVGDTVTAAPVAINTVGMTSSSGKLIAGTHVGIQRVNALSGAQAGNYSAVGLTGDYSVTKAALAVSGITVADRAYDGGTAATIVSSSSVFSGVLPLDAVAIDVGATTGTFVDKNVGSSKAVALSSVALSGNDAGNYTATGVGGATGNITRLAAVTWVGGATGNWFDPANWAGGAVPDLANVANVLIPANVTVSFDSGSVVSPAQAGPVSVDSVTGNVAGSGLRLSAGNLNIANALHLTALTQSGGTLAGTGGVIVDTFNQTGGTLANTGDLTVNKSFTQAAPGTAAVAGNVGITQATGDLILSSLAGNNLTLTATNGAVSLGTVTAKGTLGVTAASNIVQTGTVIAVGASTLAATAGDITLANVSNDFSAVNASGRNIALADANGIVLGAVAATGSLGVRAVAGAITQANGTQATVAGVSTLAASGGINLSNPGNNFTGVVNAAGSTVSLATTNALVLGRVISTSGVRPILVAPGGITIAYPGIPSDVSFTRYQGAVGAVLAADSYQQLRDDARYATDSRTDKGIDGKRSYSLAANLSQLGLDLVDGGVNSDSAIQ